MSGGSENKGHSQYIHWDKGEGGSLTIFCCFFCIIFLRRCVNGAQGSEPASQKVCECLRKQGGETIAFNSIEQAILEIT